MNLIKNVQRFFLISTFVMLLGQPSLDAKLKPVLSRRQRLVLCLDGGSRCVVTGILAMLGGYLAAVDLKKNVRDPSIFFLGAICLGRTSFVSFNDIKKGFQKDNCRQEKLLSAYFAQNPEKGKEYQAIKEACNDVERGWKENRFNFEKLKKHQQLKGKRNELRKKLLAEAMQVFFPQK